MQPTIRPISRAWRRACRCLLRRGAKVRPVAIRDFAPRLVASASAPMPPRPTTLLLGEPISPIRLWARLIHIGVRPTAQPMDRHSRTFRRFHGTTRARVRSWRSFPAIRWVMAPTGFVEASWRNKTFSLKWRRAAEAQAGAPRALRQQIRWWAAVARDTPNLRGKRG